MPKGKIMGKVSKLDPFKIRKCGYKVLLFADNRQHMSILRRLSRHPDLSKHYVGAWHLELSDDGSEIVKGLGKKHCHIIFNFPNARYWSAVCKSLGFVDQSGAPDTQFVRPIGVKVDDQPKGTIEGGYVYLVHANKADKDSLPVSSLFGNPEQIAKAEAAIVAYQSKRITLAESLDAIRNWINSQYGQRITANNFVAWVTKTPYVRSAQNPWVREMIYTHNQAVSNSYSEQQLDMYKAGYEKYKEIYDRWIGTFEEIV